MLLRQHKKRTFGWSGHFQIIQGYKSALGKYTHKPLHAILL